MNGSDIGTYTDPALVPPAPSLRDLQINQALLAAKGQIILGGHAYWCCVQTSHHNSAKEIIGGHCACGYVQTLSLINHCLGIEDK